MFILFILLIFCFLALAAFFSGSETAIISVNKIRLKYLADRGNSRAKILIWLLAKPERLLGTVLVGTNVFVVASTTLATAVIMSLLEHTSLDHSPDLGSLITTLIMTPTILIFGEIIPKSISRARANSIALSASVPLKWALILLYPLIAPIKVIASSIALMLGDRNHRASSSAMKELEILARLGEEEGLLRPPQSKMVHGVFELREQTLERVMVPLVDVVSVEKNTSLEEFFDITTKTRFSRFPVYEDRSDNIIGIVNVSDVLYSDIQTGDISPFVREDVVYLPESKHLASSLRELQHGPHPMGIVVDEYGGVVGIVTLEDIVSEIVGEIDETDQEKCKLDSSTLECDGRTEIDEINELLGTDIPKEEYETIAGFVIEQMDKIPKPGEETRWKNLRIRVLQANKRSVLRVRLILEKEDNEG